ncbi:unnamed protein product [Phytomonas sp. EM1]|nr:unnamed protein product [Phytomonas sp. EM1]|eukprot:CCW61079.1 unnamed protein product [Phytomonas sp. isolate EM1]
MPNLFSAAIRPYLRSLWSGFPAMTAAEDVKMILVVRKDLKMGTGKIAAQCAHAGVAVVEEVLCLKSAYQRPIHGDAGDPAAANLATDLHPWIRWHDTWRVSGSTKVVLQCPDEAALQRVAARAREKRLPYYIVRDAGRTQVAAGSKTVVAVGPGPRFLVDQVTGDLKLL